MMVSHDLQELVDKIVFVASFLGGSIEEMTFLNLKEGLLYLRETDFAEHNRDLVSVTLLRVEEYWRTMGDRTITDDIRARRLAEMAREIQGKVSRLQRAARRLVGAR